MEPDQSVLDAFGLVGTSEPLAGGYETSVLVGGVVLKRVMDLDVAHFVQATLATVELDGVGVPDPIRTLDGAWSSGGWTATRFVAGLQSARHDHALLLHVSERLGAELAACSIADDQPVSDRTDRWAEADRHAWGEIELPLTQETGAIADVLERQTTFSTEPLALIHADLAGNTFVDPDGMPVVLDFSPAIRPARFQTGIVVADTLLWGDGDSTLAMQTDPDSLARGLLFRLVAAELGPQPGNPDRLGCARVSSALGWT